MKIAQLISMLFISVFIVSCSEPKPLEPADELIRPVKIFTVKSDTRELMRKFPAEVESHQGSLLAFRVSGELEYLDVLAGSSVEEGQLLARLYPERFQLQLDDRKARYELSKSQFARMEKLLAAKQVSDAQYDQAKANMLIADAELKQATFNLEYSQLRAPFSGTISQIYVENHENIVAKQSILFLQNQDLLDVSIRVSEGLIARVKKDNNYQPSVVFDSYPEQSYLLTLKEWDTKADPATLTYKVVFSLPKPKDFNLLSGMSGTVNIDLSQVISKEAHGVYVPVEAIFASQSESLDDKHQYVWVFEQATGVIRKTAVTIGGIQSNGIEVTSGLNIGDQVVSAGVHYLREDMKVRPWSRERGL